ncbi:hypothetical protein P4T74_20275 [Bacillus mycoides]|uniref:hypothetical protein n=1 Tax=Bacillus mycoides TaxID=1405 RepID=UPI002E230565|nr:hypothetical protein [Bacillus mycoides]
MTSWKTSKVNSNVAPRGRQLLKVLATGGYRSRSCYEKTYLLAFLLRVVLTSMSFRNGLATEVAYYSSLPTSNTNT